jgi:hemolysin III
LVRRLDHAGIFGLIAGTYTPFGLLVLHFPQILDRAGTGAAALVLTGGVCYTLGAVVYASRRPDPLPRVFGYHELFHALVIAAVALQYTAVARGPRLVVGSVSRRSRAPTRTPRR